MKLDIGILDSPYIDKVWGTVAPHIDSALKRDTSQSITLDDVYRELKNNKMLLWYVVTEEEIMAVAVTEVAEFPRRKVLHVLTLGGKDMPLWIDPLRDAFFSYMDELKLDALQAHCRLGLAKKLYTDYGWTYVTTVMELTRDGKAHFDNANKHSAAAICAISEPGPESDTARLRPGEHAGGLWESASPTKRYH